MKSLAEGQVSSQQCQPDFDGENRRSRGGGGGGELVGIGVVQSFTAAAHSGRSSSGAVVSCWSSGQKRS